MNPPPASPSLTPHASQPRRPLPPPIEPGRPLTALAPMQDVTDLAFMRVIARRAPPDFFFTEYFRVHAHSTLERHIARSITDNDTGRPIFAQVIGESLPDLERTVADLLRLPLAGIDLNLGCPAPKVYRKNVGGGLLRDLPHLDRVLGCLRSAIPGLFTVKMRIGFDSTDHFGDLLDLVEKHHVDLLSLHARTVRELYRSEVHYEFHAQAAARLRIPVLANGNITSAARAADVLRSTGAAGVMVGRSAIRNPWIFGQIHDLLSGRPVRQVPLRDVRAYVDDLAATLASPGVPSAAAAGKLKKHLNFVGQSVDPHGAFLTAMRRAPTLRDVLDVCHAFLDRDGTLADDPFPGVIARPNCELPAEDSCAA